MTCTPAWTEATSRKLPTTRSNFRQKLPHSSSWGVSLWLREPWRTAYTRCGLLIPRFHRHMGSHITEISECVQQMVSLITSPLVVGAGNQRSGPFVRFKKRQNASEFASGNVPHQPLHFPLCSRHLGTAAGVPHSAPTQTSGAANSGSNTRGHHL